jgi:AraC-like DNA-binding protein
LLAWPLPIPSYAGTIAGGRRLVQATTSGWTHLHRRAAERHLSRLLSAATGKTLPDLINARRIDAVLQRLEYSHLPISQLVLEEGFSSVTYFYTVFRRLRRQPFSSHRQRVADIPDPNSAQGER